MTPVAWTLILLDSSSLCQQGLIMDVNCKVEVGAQSAQPEEQETLLNMLCRQSPTWITEFVSHLASEVSHTEFETLEDETAPSALVAHSKISSDMSSSPSLPTIEKVSSLHKECAKNENTIKQSDSMESGQTVSTKMVEEMDDTHGRCANPEPVCELWMDYRMERCLFGF